MDATHTNPAQESAIVNSGAKTTVNILALFAIITGTTFKMMHWAGADILILTSTLLLLATLYFMYNDLLKKGNDSLVTGILSALLAIMIISGLFKRFHWAGGDILFIAAIGLAVITVLMLIFRKEDTKLPKQFAISIVLYIMYIIGAASFLSTKTQVILDQALQNQ